MNRLSALLLAALALPAVAADAPDPALQARNPSLKVQWATPDTRVPPFDRVLLAPVELAFRDVKPLTGPTGYPQGRTEFPVTDRDRERLEADVNRILREELAGRKTYALAEAAGPGVLVLKPALRDIVSRMPPEEPPGASAVYLDTVGEATLVVDFVDGATGRTLGTATDRRTAEPAGSMGDFGAVRGNVVGAGQEVRRLARRWGTSLAKRVEQLYFEAKPR